MIDTLSETRAQCAHCQTWFSLTPRQIVRQRDGTNVYCQDACCRAFTVARIARNRRGHHHRDTTLPMKSRHAREVPWHLSDDEDHLGCTLGPGQLFHYPPLRCSCSDEAECAPCHDWRLDRGAQGSAPRPKRRLIPQAPDAPDWRTVPYTEVYAYWSTVGRRGHYWTREGLLQCGLAWRHMTGHAPLSKECRQRGKQLPSSKCAYPLFGSLNGWQRAIEAAYAREVTYDHSE